MSAFTSPEAFIHGQETSCSSSNVASGWYDRESLTLYLRFNDGSFYRYDGVPLSDAQAMAYATSAGKARRQILGDPRMPGGIRYSYSRIS